MIASCDRLCRWCYEDRIEHSWCRLYSERLMFLHLTVWHHRCISYNDGCIPPRGGIVRAGWLEMSHGSCYLLCTLLAMTSQNVATARNLELHLVGILDKTSLGVKDEVYYLYYNCLRKKVIAFYKACRIKHNTCSPTIGKVSLCISVKLVDRSWNKQSCSSNCFTDCNMELLPQVWGSEATDSQLGYEIDPEHYSANIDGAYSVYSVFQWFHTII